MCMVRRLQPAQKRRLDRVVKTASKIVGSELTSLTAIYNDRSKKELAILSQTKITRPSSVRIITVRQTFLNHPYETQIDLEIIFIGKDLGKLTWLFSPPWRSCSCSFSDAIGVAGDHARVECRCTCSQ